VSTELLETDGACLTRFFGGEKGVCYQITGDSEKGRQYVQLTDEEMAKVCAAYILSKASMKSWQFDPGK